jgi:adenylosuccinate synthase
MPVTAVIGGQYGSEGKGKVAHFLARELAAAAVIRVGGPNSGHTSFDGEGKRHVLRQLPTAALEGVASLIGPGSYVDPTLLLDEVHRVDLDRRSLCIDYRAMVVTEADREEERRGGLGERIGSTCSGTGAAVRRRVGRGSQADLALAAEGLRPFVGDTVDVARRLLDEGRRVVVEGTQGVGLSLLQSPHFPFVTARDTGAAGALAEAGLSPLDVDDVTMVLRTFPIRVAGNSGPFNAEEVDWETIGREANLESPPHELTSVTHRTRRVARFDAAIVSLAIKANRPTRIVLNHLDHVDGACRGRTMTPKARRFIEEVESSIGVPIDLAGFGPGPEDLMEVGRHAPAPHG